MASPILKTNMACDIKLLLAAVVQLPLENLCSICHCCAVFL